MNSSLIYRILVLSVLLPLLAYGCSNAVVSVSELNGQPASPVAPVPTASPTETPTPPPVTPQTRKSFVRLGTGGGTASGGGISARISISPASAQGSAPGLKLQRYSIRWLP
ncbi:MAG: hypothetical protein NDJ90_11365 [Oligoflexia bacterium]|nr:hypothetical protein [Oligoflexia bacterium]